MLDTSLGVWQAFSVPLGKVNELFQFAMLNHELNAFRRRKNVVNERFSDENGCSVTTTAPAPTGSPMNNARLYSSKSKFT